ncbi:MAG TPA: hypothetical protein VF581_08230 [Flavobacterium sp.]|jgi:hypothetical protein
MKALHYFITGITVMLSAAASSQTSANPDFNLEASTILKNEMATDIRYYYYPNLQAYFDTETLTYIYSRNREWVEAKELPAGYMGYSVQNGKRVAITDYTGDTPYELVDDHRKQYPPQYITKRQPPVKAPKPNESILAYN